LDWEVVFWAVLAALALVGEIFTVSFFLAFFSVGAVVAMLAALVGLGLGVQILGFILASVLSIVALRPLLVNRLHIGGDRYEGRRGITGSSAVVTETIEAGGRGTVRIGTGEYWTARALYDRRRIEKGARVQVLDTDGLTALVEVSEDEEGRVG
jgi:membrane protein implicated in regulation of membrane protease activity